MKEFWISRLTKLETIEAFTKIGFNIKNLELEEHKKSGQILLKIEYTGADGFLYSKYFNDYGEVVLTKNGVNLKPVSDVSDETVFKTWFEIMANANVNRTIDGKEYGLAFYETHKDEISKSKLDESEKVNLFNRINEMIIEDRVMKN